MGPVGDKDDPASATAPRPSPRRARSRMDADNLAAAEASDRIAVGRPWRPARKILLLIGVPAIFWALVAFLVYAR